jgi:hypothetical protein
MANLQFSRDEVAALAGKIGELEARLSPKERALLLAIFAAAAASAEPATRNHEALLTGAEIRQPESGHDDEPDSGDDEREELGDLQRQLLNAYIPGNSFDSLGGIVATIKIIPGDANGGNGP